MSSKFQCPKCLINLSSKQMLDFHLYKRKKPCKSLESDQIDEDSSSTKIHNFLCESTQIHIKWPENSRISPENSRKTAGELPNFPENSRLTKKNLNKKFNNDNEPVNEIIEIQLPINDRLKKEQICEKCGHKFSRSDSLKRHLEFYCKAQVPEILEVEPPQQLQTVKLEKEIDLLKRKIEEMEKNDQKHSENLEKLKAEPKVVNNNQILQILCVGGNQNYLEMLTEHWGDYDKALCFIKDCALSNLTGDCKLLEKIYFSSKNSNECPIKYLDKNRKKLEYLDENKEKVIDPQGLRLAKILANNLQNSYLQGVNYLINKTLENRRCPNQFLDEYDIQSWNNHIYELSDIKYQKKIINNLDIPS